MPHDWNWIGNNFAAMISHSSRLALSPEVLFLRCGVIALLLLLGHEDSGMLHASQASLAGPAAQVWLVESPLTHAHSHNDYLRKRPLWDALQAGFGSLEIDVYAHKQQLVVSHLPRGLNHKPNLESLYLEPLWKHIQVNGGRVFAEDTSALTLMIDFKTSGAQTLDLLVGMLQAYPDLFLPASGLPPPVRVVISGSRPDPALLTGLPFPLKLDGRLEHLGSEHKAIYPWVSASWQSHFGRKRLDQLSREERTRLEDWCIKARESGQQLRFWATPEDPNLWEDLLAIGVYRINTDRPVRFKAFWDNRIR